MNIKVEYGKTETEKKLEAITKTFGQSKEYEPKPILVPVHGLKPAAKVLTVDMRRSFDVNTDEACLKITGLTPAEYQAKHGVAYNA